MVGQHGGGSDSKGASKLQTPSGPSECAFRGRAEDAAEAAKDMVALMDQMDPEVVKRLVHARKTAVEVYKAFPGGDQRFVSMSSESEGDEEDVEVDGAFNDIESEELSGDYQEQCRGLFDMIMDSDPVACLERARKEYDVDLVKEMDKAELSFFERIRLANMLRKTINEGTAASEAVKITRHVLETKDAAVLKDAALLEPVIEGDLLLTVLESEDSGTGGQDEDKAEIAQAIQDSLGDTSAEQ